MERVPRQKYTKEFREQAVQLVQEQKFTVPEAARRLAISGKTLANWVFRARRGQLATLGETRRSVTELEAEVSRLNRELAEARMERDILKKAPVSSTDQCNTLWDTVEWEGDWDGTDGASGLVCGPESGPVAAMETGPVVKRDWPGARQARGIDSWRGVFEWRVHSHTPPVAFDADARGARRDFAGSRGESLHPIHCRDAPARTIHGQP